MRRLLTGSASLALALVATAGASCGGTHKVAVEPVEIKPIHVTIDINVKIDRELDDFFDFEKPPAEAAPKKEVPK